MRKIKKKYPAPGSGWSLNIFFWILREILRLINIASWIHTLKTFNWNSKCSISSYDPLPVYPYTVLAAQESLLYCCCLYRLLAHTNIRSSLFWCERTNKKHVISFALYGCVRADNDILLSISTFKHDFKHFQSVPIHARAVRI